MAAQARLPSTVVLKGNRGIREGRIVFADETKKKIQWVCLCTLPAKWIELLGRLRFEEKIQLFNKTFSFKTSAVDTLPPAKEDKDRKVLLLWISEDNLGEATIRYQIETVQQYLVNSNPSSINMT